MKVIKKELPEGVRKKFVTKIGKKVKIVNSRYSKKIKLLNNIKDPFHYTKRVLYFFLIFKFLNNTIIIF